MTTTPDGGAVWREQAEGYRNENRRLRERINALVDEFVGKKVFTVDDELVEHGSIPVQRLRAVLEQEVWKP